MNELEIGKAVSEVVKQFSKPVLDGVGKLAKEARQKLEVILNTCFTNYLIRNYDKHSKTKTILYRDAPVSLKEFYVRTDLQAGFLEIIKECNFFENILANQRIIISGTAGSGKSTFCKSIFLDLVENPIGIIPIFVELRQLNSEKTYSLLDFVLNYLNEFEPNFSKEQLEYSLALGKILLIFDGFDELNNESRETYEKEIVKLATKYQNVLVIVSSRPDDRFQSWEEFHTYKILPLDKEKAKELVNKLNYDKPIQIKFWDALDKELFEKHKSFASNPLLLTMMLLTYEQIAEIPNKIHLFYEQAFLTLFNKHDSLKNLYKRKSHSGLPLDEFKKLLSAFSVVSYADKKYYFSEDEIKKYLDSALKVSGISLDSNLFLKDLLDTVCIMQRDGNGYTFTHRSFQEYFTATFLVNSTVENKYQLIDKLAFVNPRDDVISMAFDINQDLLEKEWLIPKMELLVSDFSKIPNNKKGKVQQLALMYGHMTTDFNNTNKENGIGFSLYREEGDYSYFVYSILYKIYNNEMNSYRIDNKEEFNLETRQANEKLVEFILMQEGRQVDLQDFSFMDDDLISLINEAKCNLYLDLNINYIKEKISSLHIKYSEKQKELSDLLFS